jgi:hypothetical protein
MRTWIVADVYGCHESNLERLDFIFRKDGRCNTRLPSTLYTAVHAFLRGDQRHVSGCQGPVYVADCATTFV